MHASFTKSIQLYVQWNNFNNHAIFRCQSIWANFESFFERYRVNYFESKKKSNSNLYMYFSRTIDEWLPKAVLDGAQIVISLFGSIVITATASPYFLIPVSVLGVIFMYIRKVYLKTSKNIKRIEGIGMWNLILFYCKM